MAKVKSERLKSGNIIKMRDASNKPRGYFRVSSVKKSRDNPAMVQVSGQWKGAPGTGGHHGDFGKSVSLPFEKGEEWELVQAKDIKERHEMNIATLAKLTGIREALELDLEEANQKKAEAYVKRIKNKAKRAYAEKYLKWAQGGFKGPNPDEGSLSYMAAQGVRLSLADFGYKESIDEAYSPAKEIEGQFTKAVGYCLKHGLLELSDTKEIMKTVKAVAARRHK